MNQEIISVILSEIDGIDTLCFEFEDGAFNVNLNDTIGQQSMKEVFSRILKELYNKEVHLELRIADDYKKGLYKEVCTEYIADLNNEIAHVRDELLKI